MAYSNNFNLNELSALTGIGPKTLLTKANRPESFNISCVSSTGTKGIYVIDKDAFFTWYRRAMADGTFEELFKRCNVDHAKIVEAMKLHYDPVRRRDEALKQAALRQRLRPRKYRRWEVEERGGDY